LETLENEAKQAEKELDLDLDLPISTLLKEGTKRAHVQAENSAGAEALVKGELPLEEYIKWLVVLWRVYE
jgi:heme oxygenase